jgi:hypothetical protein
VVSRKASVLFLIGSDAVETVSGSLRQAAALVRAVESAQTALNQARERKSLAS